MDTLNNTAKEVVIIRNGLEFYHTPELLLLCDYWCDKVDSLEIYSDEFYEAIDNLYSSEFEGDPDFFVVDGVSRFNERGIPCTSIECGNTVYVCISELFNVDTLCCIDEDITDSEARTINKKAIDIVTAFYGDDFENSFVSGGNTWGDWNEVKNGVAYRGGKGYVYSLHEHKDQPTDTETTEIVESLFEALLFVESDTADFEDITVHNIPQTIKDKATKAVKEWVQKHYTETRQYFDTNNLSLLGHELYMSLSSQGSGFSDAEIDGNKIEYGKELQTASKVLTNILSAEALFY